MHSERQCKREMKELWSFNMIITLHNIAREERIK